MNAVTTPEWVWDIINAYCEMRKNPEMLEALETRHILGKEHAKFVLFELEALIRQFNPKRRAGIEDLYAVYGWVTLASKGLK